jgi:hypothetical protein
MKQVDYAQWFARSNGNWTSSRRYLYGPKRKANNYDTKFSVNAEGSLVSISWDGDASSGNMKMTIEGDLLKRDVGYFTNDPTESTMTMVDDDTVVFETSYDGTTYREEIRMLFEDTVRLRQTVATEDGAVTLVGQYFEERADGQS